MRKYLFVITMTVLSFSFIVATPSCADDSPEVVVGDRGEKGDKGDTGNANVRKFTFEVEASQWESAHFGASNSHSYFEVKPELTGGIRLSDINYVPLVYARPSEIYREYKQIPYRFNVENNYAILLEMSLSRHYLIMTKSTNGITTLSVPLSERPSKIQYTIIMIEIEAANAAKGKVNFDNYNEISSYFKLN